MDKNTIFSKTREGEEAVRQRTRLVQRNLRNILIMVDGYSTVGDLARRFGDASVVESSLAELERSGFIADILHDVLPIAAARRPAVQPQEEIPLLTTPVSGMPPAPASPGAPLVEEIVLPPLEDLSGPPSEPFFQPAEAARPDKPAAPSWRESLKAPFERMRAGLTDTTKRFRPEKAGGEHGTTRLEPRRRGSGVLYLGWPLLTAMTLLGVFVVLALVVLLFPYDSYLPDIERRASEVLNDEVRIGRISFSFLPRPNITLERIAVGKNGYLAVGTARVVPDVFSLLSEQKALRELHLDRISVKNQGLPQIAQWGKGGAGLAGIRHASLSGVSVEMGGMLFDGMSGELQLTPGGAPETIQLHNGDSSLKLDLQPKGGAFKIDVSGTAWKMPFMPGLTFDHLEAQGELGATRLDLSRIEGRLYDGLVSGNGSIDWARGAALAADIELKRLNLVKLLPVLSPDIGGEGEGSGRIHLESKADAPGKLNESLRVTAGFEVRHGAMKGFDLGEAVRNTGRSPTRGGITRFELFSGNLLLDQQACRLSNLRLGSGLMKSRGYLNIGKDKRLSGVMEVEFKGSAALIKAPVAIGGTLKEPLLMPAKGASPAVIAP